MLDFINLLLKLDVKLEIVFIILVIFVVLLISSRIFELISTLCKKSYKEMTKSSLNNLIIELSFQFFILILFVIVLIKFINYFCTYK
jgi:hypothetical protein